MKKIFNCINRYLVNNFAKVQDESFAFFEMAADRSSYRLHVFSYRKFFQKQALGTGRRVYYFRLFDNPHCGCVDDHEIYFFKAT